MRLTLQIGLSATRVASDRIASPLRRARAHLRAADAALRLICMDNQSHGS